MNEKYNGWTNYETWLCGLWYNEYFSSTIREMDEDSTIMSKYELANWCKDTVDEIENMEADRNGLAADLFNAAMQRIDWQELADHIWDDQLEAVRVWVEELMIYSDNWDELESDHDLELTDDQWELLPESLDKWLEEIDIVGFTPQELADKWNEEIEEVIEMYENQKDVTT